MRSTILPSTQPPAGDYIHLNPHPDRHHQIDITKYIHLVPLVHPSSYAVGNPAHHQASPNRVVRVGTEGTLHRVEDEPHPSGLCGPVDITTRKKSRGYTEDPWRVLPPFNPQRCTSPSVSERKGWRSRDLEGCRAGMWAGRETRWVGSGKGCVGVRRWVWEVI
nr:hypothetical protein L204_03119 [Cryptococcus depauperatus CBS 7855]